MIKFLILGFIIFILEYKNLEKIFLQKSLF